MKLKNKRQINLIISLILALLAVIFVVLNTKLVEINFGLFSFKLPLIIVLVVMIIIGVLLGYFLGHDQQIVKKKN
ncbi:MULTISPECIES: lipopolysaccharide assembly protein LapA domain-containing protein [Lactobacillus]|uniref:lipopolysaccharide assembly protein LapA domain-containing protein n=1 Tax=Lactobacillus TaxID=1578 RepID=UPI00248FC9D9|nr:MULTISPECIES: lipopolysaccharide assembly protein LapA domain-containing protein [Lactobacillus]